MNSTKIIHRLSLVGTAQLLLTSGVYSFPTSWLSVVLTPCCFPPQLDHDEAQERVIEAEDGDGEGWVDTHHFSAGGSGGGEGTARAMEAPADPTPPPPPPPSSADQQQQEEGEDEACDMEEFEEAALDDPVSDPEW